MNNIVALIIFYANLYGINPNVALSVAAYESNFNPTAIGEKGEIGIYQLRPEYFVSKKSLFDPETNIKLGIRHLLRMKQQCKHQQKYTYIVCYNLGLNGGAKIRFPEKHKYYKEILRRMTHAPIQNWR